MSIKNLKNIGCDAIENSKALFQLIVEPVAPRTGFQPFFSGYRFRLSILQDLNKKTDWTLKQSRFLGPITLLHQRQGEILRFRWEQHHKMAKP